MDRSRQTRNEVRYFALRARVFLDCLVVPFLPYFATRCRPENRWPRQIMTNKSISRLAWTLGLPGLALATGHPVYIAVSGYPELGMLDWMIAIVTEAILVSFLILVCWHSILNARNGKRDGLG